MELGLSSTGTAHWTDHLHTEVGLCDHQPLAPTAAACNALRSDLGGALPEIP